MKVVKTGDALKKNQVLFPLDLKLHESKDSIFLNEHYIPRAWFKIGTSINMYWMNISFALMHLDDSEQVKRMDVLEMGG